LPPLTEAEVARFAASAWRYQEEGKNLVGCGRAIVTAHALIDGLMLESPDAFLLLMMLKRHHWGRDFVVANAMAPIMPGGGWTLRRLQCARKTLVDQGYIELVRPAGYLSPATYRLTNKGVSVNAYQ
jgi:hypothetical protein